MTLVLLQSLIVGVWLMSLALLIVGTVKRIRFFVASRHLAVPASSILKGNDLPRVTIQLPIRNERNVVRGLLESVFRLDYPSDRLEIQILDDSSDPTSTIIDEMVAAYRGNVSVMVLRRKHNDGFKAGALAAGLKVANGDFIAVFDADSKPDSDFLRRILPPFLEMPTLGMAQACLRFRNRDKNLLTRMQAIMLETHMYVDQSVSSTLNQPFQFNGTSGVWRKSCLEDCGGWTFASITEDLEISFRALSRRWRFLQLPHVSVETELPESMGGYRSQQNRWTRGAGQVFRNLFKPQVRKNWSVGWGGAVLYTGRKSIFLFLVAMAAVLPFTGRPGLLGVTAFATLFAYLSFLLCAYQSQKVLGRSGFEVVKLSFPMGSLIAGFSLSQAFSFLKGIMAGDCEFIRTPKNGDESFGNKYFPVVDSFYLAELFMVFLYISALVMNRDSSLFWFAAVAWLAFAFSYVGLGTLWSQYVRGFSWSR